MHRPRIVAGLACLAAFASRRARPGVAHFDPGGRVQCMELEGEMFPVRTDVRLFRPGWKGSVGLGNARDVKAEAGAAGTSGRVWTGRIEVAAGQVCRFREVVRQTAEEVRLEITLTAESDVAMEGANFWVEMPVELFAGGRAELSAGGAGGAGIASVVMAAEPPKDTHILKSADADRITVSNREGSLKLLVALDRARHVQVQDSRKWKTPRYGLYIVMHGGAVKKGESAAITATLGLEGQADHAPVELSVDARERLYRLDGFGGNYCFNIESPVTDYTLRTLRVAWARTEMTLAEWEPRNDNADPRSADRDYLESQDRPGTNLRREFELMQRIQERGIPYCVSIWDLPPWMYADSTKPPRSSGRRIAPGMWPEVLESIGTYLLHAQRKYAAEPDLFSFNEPDWGVRVRLSPEEHRDAVAGIGAHLRGLGLKTRMLLADVTNPRGTVSYAEPTAESPEAMRYAGAVGFHSWGGASPDEYRAWSDLARGLRLPLLVTELGVDAQAWRSRAYDTWPYALRELRLYQEILLHARPQGTMQWEYTSDYGLVKARKPGSGEAPSFAKASDGALRSSSEGRASELAPTKRYWFVRQFSNLTPPGADALLTRSSAPNVLFTAFASPKSRRGRSDAGTVYAFHVANLGASREMRLSGVPAHVRSLHAVVTSRDESFRAMPPVAVGRSGGRLGELRMELAPQSLTTLTNRVLDAAVTRRRP